MFEKTLQVRPINFKKVNFSKKYDRYTSFYLGNCDCCIIENCIIKMMFEFSSKKRIENEIYSII